MKKKIYNNIKKMVEKATLAHGANTIYSINNRPLVLQPENYYKENPEELRAWIGSTIYFKNYNEKFITPEIAVKIWGTDVIKANEIQRFNWSTDDYQEFDGTLYENAYENKWGIQDEFNPIINKYSTGVWTYVEYLSGAKFRYR